MHAQQFLDAVQHLQNPGVRGNTVPATDAGEPSPLSSRLQSTGSRPKRKLQERRILLLVTAAAVLAVGIHFLHEFQIKRNVRAFLRQADLAEGQGNQQQAAAYLSGYLGYKPEDASTRTRYALLLDDLATSPKARLRAVQALEQALQHEPRNEKLRRRVAKTEMEIRQFANAAK